ncbi:hypothetical protein GCM10027299_49590 [Larkinella ripae]
MCTLTNPANAATGSLKVEQLANHSLKELFTRAEETIFWRKLAACYYTSESQHLAGHFVAYWMDIWIDGTFYKLDEEVLWVALDVTQLKKAQVELEQQIMSLKEAKQQVEIDLVRIQVAEKEVGKALNTEREMNKLKSEFINLVSHQFRNPLTSIFLKAEALKRLSDGCSDPAFAHKVIEYSEQVGRDIHRLNKLINEVLYNERLRLGQVEIHQEQVDLVHLFQQLIHQQQHHDPAYQRVHFECKAETVMLWIDETLFEQVLENLISNALKYSEDSDQPVEVGLEETEDAWIIAVKDYGIGIPADDLKHVTQSFYRASNTKLYPGTGLGLNLSYRFTQMHGGELTIESEEGIYTLCKVSLPKHPKGGSDVKAGKKYQ